VRQGSWPAFGLFEFQVNGPVTVKTILWNTMLVNSMLTFAGDRRRDGKGSGALIPKM
jgi:hypothetical protein